MPIAGRYGRRRPNKIALARAPKFSRYWTGAVPVVPAFEDYLAPLGGWQMLGNGPDPSNPPSHSGGWGNCVSVEWANNRRLVTTTLTSTPYYPTYAQVMAVYQTQNPGGSDQGMDIETLLKYLMVNGGPDGVKLLGYGAVDYTNPAEIDAAVAIVGSVNFGCNVQQVNETEFGNGQPWDHQAGSPILGGHCMIAGGYGAGGTGQLAGTLARGVTWAEEISYTPAFWAYNVDECWALIWPEHLGSKQFLANMDVAQLAADYTAITGDPFPGVIPPPPPPPVTGGKPSEVCTGVAAELVTLGNWFKAQGQ